MVAEEKPKRDRLKNCLKVASSRDSCLEDYISGFVAVIVQPQYENMIRLLR